MTEEPMRRSPQGGVRTASRVGPQRQPTEPLRDPDDAELRAPGPTILVVDDDPKNLKLARILLESEGFSVRLATDAISMYEHLKTCDPALILMDIQLPGMDGWELIARLKRNFATQMIPVIALTAYGMKGDEEHALALGCAEFIAKPISTEQLPAIVKRHIATTGRR
jgi:CheY-like chemotaxis protein